MAPIATLSLFFYLLLIPSSISAVHVINFQSPDLYPESFSWDPIDQHFVVGSLRRRSLVSVSDASVAETLISDPTLPLNSVLLGIAIDKRNRRVLATINSPQPFYALAAYDLRNRSRIFLAPLSDPENVTSIANDVAVDYEGNAYVTNSAGNLIWKVTPDGASSVFSRSAVFTSHPIEENKPYSFCGLNGIVYISKGYLLVVQSNTGKLFKVNAEDGSARTVLLNVDLTAADGIAVRRDGVIIVVSQYKAYFIKSDSSWAEGVVFDETALETNRFPTAVTVGADDRVYVLYGHVDEGLLGNSTRGEFSIVEIESEKEKKEDAVWIYVLIGFGFAYFVFWRFQMRHLYTNMNKKRS